MGLHIYHGNDRNNDWRCSSKCCNIHRWQLSREVLGGGDNAALDEKKHHNKALEDYQVAYAKYNRHQLLDWIQTNTQIKAQAKKNFTNTDYTFKLYNQQHPNQPIAPLKEHKFSDFYQPSEQQKKGKLVFLGAGTLALGYAAFCFL